MKHQTARLNSRARARFPLALRALSGAVPLFLLACGGGDARPDSTSAAASRDSAGGAVATVGGDTALSSGGGSASYGAPDDTRAPNEMGRIPVLEYHLIVPEEKGEFTRTPQQLRADLDELYKRGYRPVNMVDVIDKKIQSLPRGVSPVVLVFDDASTTQFRYIERNGKLEIDPSSALGIWLDFAKSHPGWKNRAVFCMLNGGAVGHNFFGDNPKWGGQKKEWRHQKVKWLADQGFELCSHTLWHAKLNKYPDAVVQEQIARNVMGIDSAVAGYKVRTLALPYGIWPKNRPLAWQGSWKDPKTGKTHSYKFDAVLEVAGGPTRSPYDPQFNPKSINRIEAIGSDISRYLNKLAKDGTRFVPPGK